jgi:hypothetical protein
LLFGVLKAFLNGKKFKSKSEVEVTIERIWDELTLDDFATVFYGWITGLKCTIENGGEYYHQQKIRHCPYILVRFQIANRDQIFVKVVEPQLQTGLTSSNGSIETTFPGFLKTFKNRPVRKTVRIALLFVFVDEIQEHKHE